MTILKKKKKLKIKKGDHVIIITGKDKGKQGTVLKVLPKVDRVIIQGANVVKRHQSQSQRHEGGILEKESSIHISNVAHIDPKTGQQTRVRYLVLESGNKVRVTVRSKEILDK